MRTTIVIRLPARGVSLNVGERVHGHGGWNGRHLSAGSEGVDER